MQQAERSHRVGRQLGAVLLGWLVFFVLWSLFILGYTEGNAEAAVTAGAEATFLSAAGGWAVWHLTGRFPWPSGRLAGFLGLHGLFAVLFSLLWTALGPLTWAVLHGEPIAQIDWAIPVNSWRLLMGFWLYVILAGLSYAVRNQRRLRDQEQRAAKAAREAAEARLDALRGQLQPHFLFNALHAVTALVHANADAAEEALERLGQLLRYAIRDRGDEFVRLEEEWSFTLDYLALQRVRFGEGLVVDASCADEAAARRVPAFVLQPLVENAVRHGVEARGGRGHITMAALLDEDRALLLEVRDDGPGFGDESSGGSGLATLAERLRALYGAGAAVKWHSDAGGAVVRVRIAEQT
ncbi:MAG: histidine kinase [Rhodothermales bacterium]|nr:histidine kinase [Rhodothermales bacterium]